MSGIRYLEIGVLEVFSFDVPTSPAPAWEDQGLGLRGIGVGVPDGVAVDGAADGLRVGVVP